MIKIKHPTREAWLNAAIELIRPRFQPHGGLPKKLQAIVSFSPGSKKAGGVYFGATWTTDQTHTVSVAPTTAEPVLALSILMHELVHAARPKANHGPEFKAVAVALGLEGKMPSSRAGATLTKDLTELARALGPYPLSGLTNPGADPKDPDKPKTMRKFQSDAAPGYTAWVSAKQAELLGGPRCPVSGKPMVEVV